MPSASGQRTVTGRGQTRARVERLLARVTAVYPPELQASFTVDSRPATVGRGADDAQGHAVADQTVSRRHLTIEPDDTRQGHVVVDQGSRNGTWIDGRKIAGRTPIAHGQVLRLGEVLLVYERPESGQTQPWLDAPVVSRAAIPGESTAAFVLRAAVARVAPDPSPALIVGETGTGKELVAAELHRLSGRGGELVALNCAAISPQLVESQLFGHVRGAFTGATDANPGLVRAAGGGTLFLDEIGELPGDLQAKLLRLIQEQEVMPIGAARPIKVDVRIVAATNRDLERAAEEGAFRRDLYARLAMWQIRVPPLRERRADILSWVVRLHQRWLERRKRTGGALELERAAAEAVLLNPWPENLRGLDRLVHELGAATRPVAADELPPWLSARRTNGEHTTVPGGRRLPAPTKSELEAALRETGGSVRAMAKLYGRDRKQIYRWMEALGVAKPPRTE